MSTEIAPTVASPRPPVPDQAARDRVSGDLAATLFVEAGAGTGKTTALVARIHALVASGVTELRRVAAITFTEAAAAQLRDRVRTRLERAAADATTPPAERARCVQALRQIDEAAIATLHGFAQQLLAEHPLDAGLPPEFEVLDELAAAEVFDFAWREFVDALLDDPALAAPLETAFALGLNLAGLEALARRSIEAHDRLARPGCLPAPPTQVPSLRALVDGLGGLAPMADWCTSPDPLLARLNELAALHRRLDPLVATDRVQALRLLAGATIRCNRGRAADWDGRSPEVKERLRELDGARDALLVAEGRRALEPLLERLRDWSVEQADRRVREGRLTFHDLLVRARDLLRDRPEVRRLAAGRYGHLLVDEFQDTDPLQIEIAIALGADAAGPDGPQLQWAASAVVDGRLFFVGDPKQSIYRFRRADMAIYQRARQRFAAGRLELSTSFRTVPGAVEWVNAVFAGLLDGSDGQAPFQALAPVRPALPGSGPAVRLLGGPLDDPGAVRPSDADVVARAVRAVRDEGWPVADATGGEHATRPARFADIAVLLPARTSLPALERALEDHGVPYRVEASSLVYESQEVRELLALLRAVDDPTDALAVVAALRSPALACPDPALAAWAAAGRGWDYRRTGEPATGDAAAGPVAAALAVLADLHEARRRLDPAALLDRIVREQRLLAVALARPRPRDSWRRLRFLLDEARAFAERGGTLRELIGRIERQADDRVRVTEQVLPDEDDDAVRILTVHAAKGLEFAVTVLAGLGGRPRGGGAGPLLWDGEGSAQVRLGDHLETPGYADAKACEDAAEEQERLRLLYVAATRARDHLLVAAHHVPAKTGRPTSAQILWERAQACPQHWSPWEPAAASAPSASTPAPALRFDPERWRSDRERALATGLAAPAVTATGLARDPGAAQPAHDDEPEPATFDDDDGGQSPLPPYRRGRAGTSVGRAVHATLQTVDLPAATRLAAIARAQADAEGLPERAGEVERLAAAALAAEPVREALASGRWWRELAVVARIDGVLLEGYIDLLYTDADGELVVVDYKTDRVDGPDDAIDARYRVQTGAYALAVEATLGRPVRRAALVFLRPGGAVTRWLPDLPAEIAGARARLARQRSGPTG